VSICAVLLRYCHAWIRFLVALWFSAAFHFRIRFSNGIRSSRRGFYGFVKIDSRFGLAGRGRPSVKSGGVVWMVSDTPLRHGIPNRDRVLRCASTHEDMCFALIIPTIPTKYFYFLKMKRRNTTTAGWFAACQQSLSKVGNARGLIQSIPPAPAPIWCCQHSAWAGCQQSAWALCSQRARTAGFDSESQIPDFPRPRLIS
jgi:hypothetical protein